jgi:hypothetical protein
MLPDWSIMSIHPGETINPAASSSVRPRPVTVPIATNLPSRIATSARTQGLPAPSSTRPPRITMSYSWACATVAAVASTTHRPTASPHAITADRRLTVHLPAVAPECA